jgi:hypothetical protein
VVSIPRLPVLIQAEQDARGQGGEQGGAGSATDSLNPSIDHCRVVPSGVRRRGDEGDVEVSPTFREQWDNISAALFPEQFTKTSSGCVVGHFNHCSGEPNRIVHFSAPPPAAADSTMTAAATATPQHTPAEVTRS